MSDDDKVSTLLLTVVVYHHWHWPFLQNCTGPRFNIKMSSYRYRKSHCGDKTVVRSSYLHNGISYTGKITSFYWIRAQIPVLLQNIGFIGIIINLLNIEKKGTQNYTNPLSIRTFDVYKTNFIWCIVCFQVPSDLPTCSLDVAFCENDKLSAQSIAGVTSIIALVVIFMILAFFVFHTYRYDNGFTLSFSQA